MTDVTVANIATAASMEARTPGSLRDSAKLIPPLPQISKLIILRITAMPIAIRHVDMNRIM